MVDFLPASKHVLQGCFQDAFDRRIFCYFHLLHGGGGIGRSIPQRSQRLNGFFLHDIIRSCFAGRFWYPGCLLHTESVQSIFQRNLIPQIKNHPLGGLVTYAGSLGNRLRIACHNGKSQSICVHHGQNCKPSLGPDAVNCDQLLKNFQIISAQKAIQ